MRPRYPTDIHNAYSSLLEVTNFKVWLQTESNFLLRIQLKLVYLGPCCTKKHAVRIDEIIASCSTGYVGWSEYPVKTRAAADGDLNLEGVAVTWAMSLRASFAPSRTQMRKLSTSAHGNWNFFTHSLKDCYPTVIYCPKPEFTKTCYLGPCCINPFKCL